MPTLDFELADIHQILSAKGITKDRCLLSVKKGWINLTIDNKSVMEFNRKKTIEFNSEGQVVNLIEYKWKDNSSLKKTNSWNDLKSVFEIRIAELK